MRRQHAGCGQPRFARRVGGVEAYLRPQHGVAINDSATGRQDKARPVAGTGFVDTLDTGEILVHELMETGRFQVVERAELQHVVGEQQLQASGLTRPQGRAATGRIKNCQYLIKGAVTDFGHVSSDSGGWSGWHWDIFGGSNRAVMGVILYVVDVESGEVVASESIDESVRANDVSVQATYGRVAFGGSVFRQTPLGRNGKPEDVAKAILFLASADAAGFITGEYIAVNGGLNISILDGWWCEGYTPDNGWGVVIYARGYGGNCVYTYAWNEEPNVVGGPVVLDGITFRLSRPDRASNIVGTMVVMSGDETFRVGVFIKPPGNDE